MEEAIKKALAGSRKLRIRFKQEAIGDASYLSGMLNGGIISLSQCDKVVLAAVMQSGHWERDSYRTFVITLTEAFDQEWFTSRMNRRAIEMVEAVA